jgi:hypothetical protein
MIEIKKQKQILHIEEGRLRVVEERNERLKSIVKGDAPIEEEIGDIDDGDEGDNQERTLVKKSLEESDIEDEEEDEEMAMARVIESQRMGLTKLDDNLNSETESISKEILDHKALINKCTESLDYQPERSNEEKGVIHDSTQADDDEHSSHGLMKASASSNAEVEEFTDNSNKSSKTQKDSNDNQKESNNEDIIESKHQSDEDPVEARIESEPDSDIGKSEKRPRNAAWKAMLEKEKQLLKKQKKLRKGGAFDEEAEEEEEEEAVAGLEDFGFTVDSKKRDDEDDENDADEEDFDNIVDEVSDGEGDEEAGEEARNALQAREEKMRHKEVLRRIREGYDGKRGGVAGGSSKRGNLRFDQLVAADNKNDAKRLGLLNDDELDSEDEAGTGDKNRELDDEEVLIDRMLKDRYLNRPILPEENFSDSEQENEEEQDGEGMYIAHHHNIM